jgi:hypothetical protein
MRWLPWRSLLRRVALGHGFLDPFALMARMQRFSQPSEVAEPIELLRAGAAMHSRGLVNSRVIQNNLDWVWPYWVCRQVDPTDRSFLPRGFSITQINLTHRNWTAVGLPDCPEMPIVDPRGLVTPFLDGWSLDAWILADDGRRLFPSRSVSARQELDLQRVAVVTECAADGLRLQADAEVIQRDAQAMCRVRYSARSDTGGWLAVALRPYNTEGISFIDRIALAADRRSWSIDERKDAVRLPTPPDRHHVSHYRHGDVATRLSLTEAPQATEIDCEAGMATAAASYRLAADTPLSIGVEVPLAPLAPATGTPATDTHSWSHALASHACLQIPDERLQFLYDAAVRTLIILSPDDVYPGPSTYRRFWFRDAAFMINALLCCGLAARARRALDRFPERQSLLGYFQSQNGEWDSNGEALWTLQRYCELTGEPPDPAWRGAVLHGARWITRKRVDRDSGLPHAGLLPPGFSAEHLGPNDYYYWDDFWSEAGLRSAARLAAALGEEAAADEFAHEAASLASAIETSLASARARIGRNAMPASPYRRLDAGAIGSIVAGYPLQLYPRDDPHLLDTTEFLLRECLVDGGFFQHIIHSGINAYLTLHLAQVLMRAGDPRSSQLLEVVAKLASPTGQWPEAIHPQVAGGCMGDGQHGWAAAEWVMLLRNAFLREESARLVLGAGIASRWLRTGERLAFGPAPTAFGDVEIALQSTPDGVAVDWQGEWRSEPQAIELALPGCQPVTAGARDGRATLRRAE